jgi:hypothetical protein
MRFSRKTVFIAASAMLGFLSSSARAELIIEVNKLKQTLTVQSDGVTLHEWAVSTARSGFSTPVGTYTPQRLERSWFSKKYYNSPMPHSIFFHGGYAIHGSYEISKLGRPASHGCVRLEPEHAAELFDLVKKAGVANTKIIVEPGANLNSLGTIDAKRVRRSEAQKRSAQSPAGVPKPKETPRSLQAVVYSPPLNRLSNPFEELFISLTRGSGQ